MQTVNKLYWRKMEVNTNVCFNNSLVIVDHVRLLIWAMLFEKQRAKEKSYVYKVLEKLVVVPTLRSVINTVYRDYQLCDISFMTPRHLQDCKERTLQELRYHITSAKAKGEERCFVLLPTENAHSAWSPYWGNIWF